MPATISSCAFGDNASVFVGFLGIRSTSVMVWGHWRCSGTQRALASASACGVLLLAERAPRSGDKALRGDRHAQVAPTSGNHRFGRTPKYDCPDLPGPFLKITSWKGVRTARPARHRRYIVAYDVRSGCGDAWLGATASPVGIDRRASRPGEAFSSVSFPRCSVAIAEAMDKPNPFPGRWRLWSSR